MAAIASTGSHREPELDSGRAMVRSFPSLSPRELEVLEAMRAGARTHASIAAALDIKLFTAHAHTRNIHRKLQGYPDMDGPPLMACLAAALLMDH